MCEELNIHTKMGEWYSMLHCVWCISYFFVFLSRGTEKYFRQGRLNWPGGAVSRESIRAVKKLNRLKVWRLFVPSLSLSLSLSLSISLFLTLPWLLNCILLFHFHDCWISISLALQDLVSQHVDKSKTFLTDLLQGLLRFDPSERLTAREALNHPFFRSINMR